jgi:hypothetical protein
VLEEVPGLDDVALGILEVHGPVTTVVLDRAPVVHSPVRESADELVELSRPDRRREVDVPAPLVPELLGPIGPQAQPGALAALEPDSIGLPGQLTPAESSL